MLCHCEGGEQEHPLAGHHPQVPVDGLRQEEQQGVQA